MKRSHVVAKPRGSMWFRLGCNLQFASRLGLDVVILSIQLLKAEWSSEKSEKELEIEWLCRFIRNSNHIAT